jgi:hypothetical protein
MSGVVERQMRAQGSATIDNGAVALLALRLDGDVVHWPTHRGGVLEHLRQISERLARYYGWEPADAAVCVLSAAAPLVQAIRGEVQLKFPMAARSKIVLTIDATATPNEVAAAYAHVRRRQFGRVRRPAAKHAQLAVFALRHQSMPAV